MWFDATTVEVVRNAVSGRVAIAVLLVSFLGSIYVIAPAVTAAFLHTGRWRTRAIDTWPGIVIGGYGVFVSLKPLFSIDRPPVDPPLAREALPVGLGPLYDLGVGFGSASFPSGHAVAATVFWGLVVLDAPYGTRRTRAVVCGAVVALVCFSRIALGVHYPADVVGGAVIGLAYLALAVGLRELSPRPVRATLLLAGLFAIGGVPSGRPTDAAILLAALGVVVLVYRYGPRLGIRPADERDETAADPSPVQF
ncbi:phosphatase PAP2 family protein [Halobiforma nitratireducens]|uniref:PA-phosphatase-like phosphoesterase n=1 Tax=Halobiforma nitratireducens JCM 10879 TaxID=1227454 RepID=M0LY99_9EURY|nr:phosphatase PAP2 family protein [Halobiforma nitratireducens]EMA38542.1 PA-phosphatase-like phosphoesterase [Halobiforma nitratireducens JCM 10879]